MTSKHSKRTKWAIWILNILVMAAFVPSAIMKVTHNPMAVEGFTKMGIPGVALVPLGIVELLCVAIFLIPRTEVLGTLLLTGYLGGAVLANIINRSEFIHPFIVGLFVWVSTCLRVPEFRTLIPIRKTRQASGGVEDRREMTASN